MWETYFGFKKAPFPDCPDAKQLFASQAWSQVKARLQFLVEYHATGLLTGEVGAGKSTAARTFSRSLNPSLYKILYLHWTQNPPWIYCDKWRANWTWSQRAAAGIWSVRSPTPSCV